MSVQILQGDALVVLKTLPAESVQCCVTSPPYWGLRDYGIAGQFGLEPTPEEYVAKMVDVFREVRRVLRGDGTCWVNMGDSYVANNSGQVPQTKDHKGSGYAGPNRDGNSGLVPKNLVGIPWRVAFALQADGWWLRQDIIWHKPNPMPESVTDRCTKAHEYIFLLTKKAKYFYDAEAVKEPVNGGAHARVPGNVKLPKGAQAYKDGDFLQRTKAGLLAYSDRKRAEAGSGIKNNSSFEEACSQLVSTRNLRSVWTVPSAPYSEAHFATFPPDLIKPCILAGSKPGDTILDPFGGSGTTGMVSLELGRKAILIELNPKYVKLAHQRCDVTPGLPLA